MDSRAHQLIRRETQIRRNDAARSRRTQQRGRDLAALRRENARLQVEIAQLRRQVETEEAAGSR